MDTKADLTDTARCLMARYDKGVNYKHGETSGVAYPMPIAISKTNGEITVTENDIEEEEENIVRTISARDSKGFCQQLMSGIALTIDEPNGTEK